MRARSFELKMFYGARAQTFERAKELRHSMTPAEELLWSRLNKKQFQGYRFKAQHPVSIFIADFYCHKARLVIEVDGEIHKNSKEYDENRDAVFRDLGLKVLRISNEEVERDIDHVLQKIQQSLPLPPAP